MKKVRLVRADLAVAWCSPITGGNRHPRYTHSLGLCKSDSEDTDLRDAIRANPESSLSILRSFSAKSYVGSMGFIAKGPGLIKDS